MPDAKEIAKMAAIGFITVVAVLIALETLRRRTGMDPVGRVVNALTPEPTAAA